MRAADVPRHPLRRRRGGLHLIDKPSGLRVESVKESVSLRRNRPLLFENPSLQVARGEMLAIVGQMRRQKEHFIASTSNLPYCRSVIFLTQTSGVKDCSSDTLQVIFVTGMRHSAGISTESSLPPRP
jgi:hypothetical protein